MATTYKRAQVQGTSGVTTYSTLYNTASATTAVISTVLVCNTASASATYRIAIMDTAGTPAAENWIVYDSVVGANDTICLTLGLSLGNDDFIRISSSANTVTFTAFVSEIS